MSRVQISGREILNSFLGVGCSGISSSEGLATGEKTIYQIK